MLLFNSFSGGCRCYCWAIQVSTCLMRWVGILEFLDWVLVKDITLLCTPGCAIFIESYCVVLYTFEIKYKYHWPATATYLYKPKWKEWIHMAIRALKPLESPVIDHCRERAVVGIRCPSIGLALIPDSTKYGHVE